LHLFIAIEGGEGFGKTTQAKELYERLIREGIPAALTHEPGGSPLGEEISKWLRSADNITPHTELLLFCASRSHLVSEVIAPNLERGTVVICDRYEGSTLAYQGYGRSLGLADVEKVNELATRGLHPDLVVLLDLPVEEGFHRLGARNRDRFEQEESAFHQRVREGYLKMAQADPDRWFVVDASLPAKKISQLIWERVKPLLEKK